MKKIIGTISDEICTLLKIGALEDNNIYIGETNIAHMQSSHPDDYNKYKNEIKNILSNPDFVGLNLKDNSLEYVKEFKIDNEFVKIAVRISCNNKYYARSIYRLNNARVYSFIKKGTLKKA